MSRSRTRPLPREPIRRLPDGRYQAKVDATPKGANPRKQVTKTCDTLKEARAWVAEVRAGRGKWRQPTLPPAPPETVAQLASRWLDSRRDIRQVSRVGYQSALTPALRHLGDREITSVSVLDVEGLTALLSREGGRRGQALSPRSVRATLAALSQIFDMAAREGRVSSNPVKAVRRPRGTKREHPSWTPEQLQAFVAAADSDPWAGLWRLVACGLTRSEIAGLRWRDIDLDQGVLTIHQGRVQVVSESTVDDPKSGARRRIVPFERMWPGTAALLRGKTRSSLSVAVDAAGRPVRPQLISERFTRLVATAGLPAIRLHSVRHSIAGWLHHLGVAPADAASLLGHSLEVHLNSYCPSGGLAGIHAAAAALGRANERTAA